MSEPSCDLPLGMFPDLTKWGNRRLLPVNPVGPICARIPGIHSIGARLPHITAENSEIGQGFMSEFPTHPNREFPVALQGIESGDHGIFWPDQGRGCRDRLALAS
jgi:hypothetical protein